ncbi:hypothetical protein H5410_005884 [Solanum commersonii]|uniref:Uncharacterized protein n=1 Tax=Solanum commersonii TaxID=4109 RepID=A0A9J6A8P8_SOLCO|nr:hypothetical protein H5410_005884 [Solanum commersonii]
MGMQDHALSFSVTVDEREVVIVVRNPTFIAQLYRFPSLLPCAHLGDAITQPLGPAGPKIVITPWNNFVVAPEVSPINPPIIHASTLETTPLENSPPYGFNFPGTSSYSSPTPENLVQNIEVDQSLAELEEALVLLRETRTKIVILKDTIVMLFRERFVKKMHTHLSPESTKKLARYKIVMHPGDRKLHSNNEPNDKDWKLAESSSNDENKPTQPQQLHELHYMEL